MISTMRKSLLRLCLTVGLVTGSVIGFDAMGQPGGPPGPPGGGGLPPCWPPPCVPIDGGVIFLAAAGIAYASKKAYDYRLQQKEVE